MSYLLKKVLVYRTSIRKGLLELSVIEVVSDVASCSVEHRIKSLIVVCDNDHATTVKGCNEVTC